MCWLCKEWGEGHPYCVDCGALICFDVKGGDDILKRAAVTAGGDVRCVGCARGYDRADEGPYPEDMWEDWDLDDWPDFEEDALPEGLEETGEMEE